MASGPKVTLAGQPKRISIVANTSVALTWDLIRHHQVVIVADTTPPATSTFLPRLNLLGAG